MTEGSVTELGFLRWLPVQEVTMADRRPDREDECCMQ